LVTARVVELVDRRRQLDSQGALSRGSATDRQRLCGVGALLSRSADSRRVLCLLSGARALDRSRVVPAHRHGTAPADARIRVDGVGADRPLPGSAGPSGECAHARVLSDANHLPAFAGARMGAPVPQPESVHHAGCVLSGSAGHSGPLLGLATVVDLCRRLCGGVCRWLFRVRPTARHTGGGSVNAIEVRDVRKTYRRYGRRKSFGTLKSAILTGRIARDLKSDDAFEALKGVSFDVPTGKTLGIVGRNGSGKSTMLKLIAGIGRPTSGEVKVHGRVSALIELGAGFHPEISGRDNVFINGMMLGLSKREITERFDEIVAFAELEDFIDEPVKAYSSGMYMRLGFSVAINVDPDVLLVDEVLAVGDEAFTHKCLDKFADFRRRGRTVLLVTHSLDMVTRFCDEALWLDHGLVGAQGDPRRVIDAYLLDVAAAENKALERSPAVSVPSSTEQPDDMMKAGEGRWGSHEAEIVSVEFIRSDGVAAHV